MNPHFLILSVGPKIGLSREFVIRQIDSMNILYFLMPGPFSFSGYN